MFGFRITFTKQYEDESSIIESGTYGLNSLLNTHGYENEGEEDLPNMLPKQDRFQNNLRQSTDPKHRCVLLCLKMHFPFDVLIC